MSYQQDPYAPQDVYAQQQRLAQGDPSAQAGAYPLPQQPYGQPTYTNPGAYLPPQQQAPGQPGAYLPPQQPYGQPGAYPPPQQFYGAPPVYPQQGMRASNPWANRALYSGVLSLILALVTLFSLVGFAGLITGSFAIYRGITGLTLSNRLPGNAGRVQAIAAIVLGVLAWLLVLMSFALRGISGS